jgi:hypothetical protein
MKILAISALRASAMDRFSANRFKVWVLGDANTMFSARPSGTLSSFDTRFLFVSARKIRHFCGI